MKHEESRKIYLREGLTWKEKQIAVELARLLGFQSESAVFPVVSRESGEGIPSDFSGLDKYKEGEEIPALPQEYVPASDAAKPVPDFDWRARKGLETLFGCGDILKDEDFDLLPDKMDVHFIIPRDCDTSILAAACTFAFRMGMETTAYAGILLRSETGSGNELIFEEADTCSIRYERKEDGVRVIVAGSGEALELFAADFCMNFPAQGSFDTWTDHMQEIIDSMSMKNLDGQLAYAKVYAKPQAEVYCSPEIETFDKSLEAEFPEVRFTNFKSTEEVYEKEYDIPWEMDCFWALLETRVYPVLKAGDKVKVTAGLSEGKEERIGLEKELWDCITKTGAEIDEVTVLCAYKQGYSWLEEVVVPRLQSMGKTDSLEISFKPFLPAGKTDWADEDGATPSYNNMGADPDKWYDLPIRYLQELYPAEDMLAELLDMDREKIRFSVYEEEKDLTYTVKGFDADGQVLYENSYKAACFERPYLDAYPQMGKVHPSTGYVKVTVNDAVLLEERIETDVERIWSVYQQEILPDLRSYIETKTEGIISVDKQPFFAQLRIEAEVSEPDFKLSSREDLFTTLDGLHEDMYFAGADYFKNFGMETAGAMLDAPGLILPVLKQHEGKPRLRVKLYDQKASEPAVCCADSKVTALGTRQTVNAWLEAVEATEEGNKAVIRLEGAHEKIAAAYMELLERKLLDIGKKLHGIRFLEMRTDSGSYLAEVTPPGSVEKNLDIGEIDLLEKELIGYEEYKAIIEQLKRVPGISVYRTAVSYTGRELYAVEILPDNKGYISRTKRITNHPSEIINSRHHANEVSSTNSAFMLIKTLLTDEKYKDLANHLNLVIVPMENVDGAAIHYELQKENPNWKLHVARFNAIGREFYYEHFKPDTIHTEAMGLTRLFRSFLPDIIVDNHGVPSHEWEQQFSGYTSPSFKGFWLPRSLLYGYFWTVTDDAYKSNYAVNKKMEDVVADSISSDEEIAFWNKEWARQFEKFAHGWMPKLFPADYYKDMINYWIPFAFDSNHRYPSIRFPWITTVAYTSEVADETAQGEYLHLCARAHLNHDLATLDMMVKSTCVYKHKWNISEDGIEAANIRMRPVIV